MKLFKNGLFLIGLILFTFACKKTIPLPKDSLSKVPADAAMVTAINTKNLLEKADFNYVKGLDFYQDMLKEVKMENAALAEILEDPYKSGIDLDQNAYVYYDINVENPEDIFYGLTVSLKDKATFEAMLKNADAPDFKSKDDFQYISEGRQGIIGWDEDMIVIGMNVGYGGSNMVAQLAKTFSTDKKNSVASNKKIKQAFGRDYDIASWGSTNKIAEIVNNMPQAGMGLAMVGISADDLTDNYSTAYLDFNNGSADWIAQYDFKKGITKMISPLFKNKVKTDFSKYLPQEDLSFLMTAALDFKGIDKLPIPDFGKGLMETPLKEFGLTIDDIAEALGGDVMIAAYTNPVTKEDKSIFATNIGKTDKFEKLMSLAQEFDVLTKEGDNYVIIDRGLNRSMGAGYGSQAKLSINDGIVFVSVNNDFLASVASGGLSSGDRIDKGIYKNVAAEVMGAFINFAQLAKMDKDMEFLEIDDLKISVDNSEMDMKLNMTDKNTNSLKSIFKMINEAYLMDKRDNSYDSYDSYETESKDNI